MHKKGYQAIARAMHDAKPAPLEGTAAIPAMAAGIPAGEAYDRGEYDIWEGCVSSLADVLAADNPAFDRARFVEACETGTTRGMPVGRATIAKANRNPTEGEV